MADEDEYVESFVQGDDAALMDKVRQRETACKCVCGGVSTTLRAGQRTTARTPTLPLRKPLSRFRISCPHRSGGAAALKKALEDPPYQTRTEDVKNASYAVVASVIGTIKEAEIEKAIETLSLEQCDVLMKYLYRGLSQPGKKTEVYSVRVRSMAWRESDCA